MPNEMETRSKTSDKPLTQTELEMAQKKLAQKHAELEAEQLQVRTHQKKLQAEAAELQRQRAAFEKEKIESHVPLVHHAESNKWGNPPPPKETDHTREDPSRNISNVQNNTVHLEPPTTPFGFDSPLYDNANAPKVSFREATEGVPSFDGYNITLAQFTRACRRAKSIVPAASERNLTKLLINKLRGRAYYAVEDEPCDTVTQLIDLLNGAFGPPKTIDQYRGELSTVYLKPYEHILDYISRVKDLRSNILDAERRTHGQLDHRVVTEIETLTARSFCDGLPLEYRLQLREDAYHYPSEAFAYVKAIAKRQELDKQRFDSRRRSDNERSNQPQHIHPIGRPIAHSTPKTYMVNRPTSQWNHSRYENNRRYERSQTERDNYAPRPRDDYTSRSRDNYAPRPRDNYASRPRDDYAPRPRDNNSPATTEKICRYCKNYGHTIEECRKRQYNNNQQRQQSGNANGPTVRSDAPRSDRRQETPTRPVKQITTSGTKKESSETEPESQS